MERSTAFTTRNRYQNRIAIVPGNIRKRTFHEVSYSVRETFNPNLLESYNQLFALLCIREQMDHRGVRLGMETDGLVMHLGFMAYRADRRMFKRKSQSHNLIKTAITDLMVQEGVSVAQWAISERINHVLVTSDITF
jgi:hypothetical protein